MSQYSCPTVSVQGKQTPENPTGIVVINESDFDAETMTLAPEPEPKTEEPVVVVEEPAKSTKTVAPWKSK